MLRFAPAQRGKLADPPDELVRGPDEINVTLRQIKHLLEQIQNGDSLAFRERNA